MQCDGNPRLRLRSSLSSHKLHEKNPIWVRESYRHPRRPVLAVWALHTGVVQTIFSVGRPFPGGASAGRTLQSFPCSCHLVPLELIYCGVRRASVACAATLWTSRVALRLLMPVPMPMLVKRIPISHHIPTPITVSIFRRSNSTLIPLCGSSGGPLLAPQLL